jgi:hypothetical protein
LVSGNMMTTFIDLLVKNIGKEEVSNEIKRR